MVTSASGREADIAVVPVAGQGDVARALQRQQRRMERMSLGPGVESWVVAMMFDMVAGLWLGQSM